MNALHICSHGACIGLRLHRCLPAVCYNRALDDAYSGYYVELATATHDT